MISSLPKFRGDLDLRQQTTADGTALLVKDPSNGELFRLRETERFIIQQLDGATSLDVVQSRVEEEFGARLTPKALADFIKVLDRRGLLETAHGTREGRSGGRGGKTETTSTRPELPADPVWGKYFRQRAAENFPVRQLDGQTRVDVVPCRAEQNFATPPTPEASADPVKSSDGNGPLQYEKKPRTPNRQRRRRGTPSSSQSALRPREVGEQQTTAGTASVVKPHANGNGVGSGAAEHPINGTNRAEAVEQVAKQGFATSPVPEAAAGLVKGPVGNGRRQSDKSAEPRESRRHPRPREKTATPSSQSELRKDRIVRPRAEQDLATSPAPGAPGKTRERRESGEHRLRPGETTTTSSQPELRMDRKFRDQQIAKESTNVVMDPANGGDTNPGAVDVPAARQLGGDTPAQIAQQSAEQNLTTSPAAEAGAVPNLKVNDRADGEGANESREPGQSPSKRQEASATSSRPKLRMDLEVREQRTGERTTFVVKDPVSGEFFRLQEVERFIAQQLDGATSLGLVQSRVEKEFGGTLAPEALAGFIKTLHRNGLLETDKDDRKKRRRRRRINGSLLYLRFRLFDPDRLFTALAPLIRWCFTPAFVLLSSSLILAAVALAVFNWAEVVQDFSRLYAFSTLPLLLITIFCVLTLHEFGHGLTCKHFGGEVRELGFLLLYFQPAMYCNVSDAWLFPEKSKRLWVGFAGPYLELVLWALATLTWCVTDTATFPNTVALVVIATSGIKTFFNFNPLIKLDGYYLLSDYLDIANLRKKSFAYVGGFLKRIFGFADEFPPASPRERRIFLAYGLTASVFSFSFLGLAALTAGNFLLEQHQRAAFLGLTALIVTRLRRKFRKMFRGSNLSDDEDFDSTPPPEPGESGKHEPAEPRKIRPPEKKRMRRAMKRRIKLAALACLTLALLFLGRMELRVAGPINVLPIHNADVRTEIAGIIEEICVDEGDRVRKGDRIARLSDRDQRAELEKTQAELQQTQARLDLLVAGPTEEQIAVARMAVTKAEDRLKFAQAKLARDQSLFEQQLLSRNDFDITRELDSTAQNELAAAQGSLQVLLKGTRPEEIKAAQAELARLEAHRRFLEEQLGLLNVVSPATGVVTTPSRQLKEMARQMVQKGDMIAKVHELKTVTLQAAVSEKEIADVRAGQTVALKVRAYPDRVFHGKVTEIATTAGGAAASSVSSSTKPGSSAGSAASIGSPANTVLVTTEIDNSADLLKPGMTGMAKIYCGERRFIDLVMRRLSLTFRVEFWSWW